MPVVLIKYKILADIATTPALLATLSKAALACLIKNSSFSPMVFKFVLPNLTVQPVPTMIVLLTPARLAILSV